MVRGRASAGEGRCGELPSTRAEVVILAALGATGAVRGVVRHLTMGRLHINIVLTVGHVGSAPVAAAVEARRPATWAIGTKQFIGKEFDTGSSFF